MKYICAGYGAQPQKPARQTPNAGAPVLPGEWMVMEAFMRVWW
jgi:hypothetical protein